MIVTSHTGAFWWVDYTTVTRVGFGIRFAAARHAGVVAVQQIVDTDTGEVLEEPIILARHGELPAEFVEE